jgi:hypothetical protein
MFLETVVQLPKEILQMHTQRRKIQSEEMKYLDIKELYPIPKGQWDCAQWIMTNEWTVKDKGGGEDGMDRVCMYRCERRRRKGEAKEGKGY